MSGLIKCKCCGYVNEIDVVESKEEETDILLAAWIASRAGLGGNAILYDDREEFWKERITLSNEELAKCFGCTDYLWWVSTEYPDDDTILHGIIDIRPPHCFKIIRSWVVYFP